MEITLLDRLRPYISTVLTALLLPLFAKLAQLTGLDLFEDPAFQEAVRQIVWIWMAAVIGKTVLNKYFNPGNTSSAHLAKASVSERKVLADDIPRKHVAGTDPDRDREGIL